MLLVALLAACQGPAGADGAPGRKGDRGPQGPQGEPGWSPGDVALERPLHISSYDLNLGGIVIDDGRISTESYRGVFVRIEAEGPLPGLHAPRLPDRRRR